MRARPWRAVAWPTTSPISSPRSAASYSCARPGDVAGRGRGPRACLQQVDLVEQHPGRLKASSAASSSAAPSARKASADASAPTMRSRRTRTGRSSSWSTASASLARRAAVSTTPVADGIGFQHGEHRLRLGRPLGERLAVMGRDQVLSLREPAGVAEREAPDHGVPPGVPGQWRVDVLALGLAPCGQLGGGIESAEPRQAVRPDQAGEGEGLPPGPGDERPRRVGGGPWALRVEQHDQAPGQEPVVPVPAATAPPAWSSIGSSARPDQAAFW